MRWIICGGPNTGKTTYANAAALHTDDLYGQGSWVDQVATVARWYDAPGPWTVEGVLTVEALEQWFATHPTGSPCDRITYFIVPFKPQDRRQAALSKGIATRWHRIVDTLRERGVEIEVA